MVERQSKDQKIYHAFRLIRRIEDDKKELKHPSTTKAEKKQITKDIHARRTKLNKYSERIKRAAKSPAAYRDYA